MGRGGGGGGGGSHGGGGHSSGGSHGGSFRSSGGGGRGSMSSGRSSFSGGSSFSHGRGGGGYGGGPGRGPGFGHRPPPPPPPRHRTVVHHYGHGPGPGVYYETPEQTRVRAKYSFLSTVLVIAFILVLAVGTLIANSISSAGGITKSTIDREPLDKKYVTDTGEWMQDDIGWIRSQSTVKKGLKYFYDKTGVMPYLVVTETVNGSYHPTGQETWNYGDEVYRAMFKDEGHMVFVFQCQDEGTEYTMAAVTGAQAKTVLDDEALEILYDYFDSYFWSDRDEDEMFADAFSDAADRIMKKTPNYMIRVIEIAGVIAIGFIILQLVKARDKREKERAEETERILNTPVEKIGDDGLDDLKAKYTDSGGDAPIVTGVPKDGGETIDL